MTSYDPGKVALGSSSTSPYLPQPGYRQTVGDPVNGGGSMAQPLAAPQQGVLGSEAVRATGSGPFDASYRQNLASFAGGQWFKPNGFLGLDPTGSQLFGNPTGGGTAPIAGMPNSLLDYAMGGSPFSWMNPLGSQNASLSSLPFMGGGGGTQPGNGNKEGSVF